MNGHPLSWANGHPLPTNYFQRNRHRQNRQEPGCPQQYPDAIHHIHVPTKRSNFVPNQNHKYVPTPVPNRRPPPFLPKHYVAHGHNINLSGIRKSIEAVSETLRTLSSQRDSVSSSTSFPFHPTTDIPDKSQLQF